MSRTTDPGGAPRGARGPSRRIVLRTAFTAAVVTGTAGTLLPLRDDEPGTASAPAPAKGSGDPAPRTEEFAEMYRGREIRGNVSVLVPAGEAGGTAADRAEPVIEIRIDGRPLHVMRRADGTYLSEVTHYESFPTLRETARAAVDELGTARLALPASQHHR
ncbi:MULTISPECIES: tyrosinase family oxidase copper chaperone [unclassified Streptomyces]|uniref:tyrosinase family oxidase copper chaperone n=1 Tax=unclassified Streptomyces TaxID=2593676 RepID=UPI00344B0F4F